MRPYVIAAILAAATVASPLAAPAARAAPFTLSSPDFGPGRTIPTRLVSCGGANATPTLAWRGAPAGTAGFALIVFDTDKRVFHWVVPDMPASAHGVPEGVATLPNVTGHPGWHGPCPPVGDAPHHYLFTLYALRAAPPAIPSGADDFAVRAALEKDALATATLTGLYGRAK